MDNSLTLSEQIMYSTVRIECFLGDGSKSTGTGFFYTFLGKEDIDVPAIVTNKHVIRDSWLGRIHLTVEDSKGNPINTEHIPIEFGNFQNMWLFHPDPDVDLCMMPMDPIFLQCKELDKNIFYKTLDKSLIPNKSQSERFGAIEEITMVGYPSGLWDEVNNLPIIRRGITATHPNVNYNGREEIMVDIACFPGSSGSPVLILNETSYSDRTGVVLGQRVHLIGILYAGPQFTTTGDIHVVNIPTSQKPISVSQIPMNLGLIVKSHKLLDFERILLGIEDMKEII